MILPPRIFHREWLPLIHVGVIFGVLDIRGDPVVTEVTLVSLEHSALLSTRGMVVVD